MLRLVWQQQIRGRNMERCGNQILMLCAWRFFFFFFVQTLILGFKSAIFLVLPGSWARSFLTISEVNFLRNVVTRFVFTSTTWFGRQGDPCPRPPRRAAGSETVWSVFKLSGILHYWITQYWVNHRGEYWMAYWENCGVPMRPEYGGFFERGFFGGGWMQLMFTAWSGDFGKIGFPVVLSDLFLVQRNTYHMLSTWLWTASW